MCTRVQAGVWRGRSVAKVHTSPTGMTILVGRSAADNDILTLKLARATDFWLHVAGHSGAHVVVLNPEKVQCLDRATLALAATLAVRNSSGRDGGRTAVHYARCGDVEKPRGLEHGKVRVRRHRVVYARPEPLPGEEDSA